MRINPGLQVLSLDEGTLQIGTGRRARWITGLSAQERRFVLALCADGPPAVPDEEESLGRARRGEILGMLAPLLLDDSTAPSDEEPTARLRQGNGLGARMAPDVLAWSEAYAMEAAPVLKARAEASIGLYGCGRAGALLANILAAAGVGGLLLCDPRELDAQDLGAGTSGITAVGSGRARATARALASLYPHLEVAETQHRGPEAAALDVAVVIAGGELPPVASLPADTAMLPILFTDTGVRIGPMSIDGLSMCAPCAWEQCDPRLRMLDSMEDHLAPVALRPEASLAAVAAGIAAMQVLMVIDRINVPATAEAMILWELATGSGSCVAARSRPHCTCMNQLVA